MICSVSCVVKFRLYPLISKGMWLSYAVYFLSLSLSLSFSCALKINYKYASGEISHSNWLVSHPDRKEHAYFNVDFYLLSNVFFFFYSFFSISFFPSKRDPKLAYNIHLISPHEIQQDRPFSLSPSISLIFVRSLAFFSSQIHDQHGKSTVNVIMP